MLQILYFFDRHEKMYYRNSSRMDGPKELQEQSKGRGESCKSSASLVVILTI